MVCNSDLLTIIMKSVTNLGGYSAARNGAQEYRCVFVFVKFDAKIFL
jgi:hypothetical protein